jgi:hypothetical protein
MIDHEFSTYFMFPDNINQNLYWYEELKRAIRGLEPEPDQYASISDPAERELVEQSARRLYKNLCYIKAHYPKVMAEFVENISELEQELLENRDAFCLQKNSEYPDQANSNAYLIGKARYKDKDEEKAIVYEKQFGGNSKTIDFDFMNRLIIGEIKEIMRLMKEFTADF